MASKEIENGNGRSKWALTKDKILLSAGLVLIALEFINAEILGREFHGDFLLVGCSLCGISAAVWADRKGKG